MVRSSDRHLGDALLTSCRPHDSEQAFPRGLSCTAPRHHDAYPSFMPTSRPEPTAGWPVFLAWSLGGALASFSLAGAASVGLFIMPLAAALIYPLTR